MASPLPMPGHSDTSIIGLVFLGLVLVVVSRVPPGRVALSWRGRSAKWKPGCVVAVGIPASSGWAWSIAAVPSRSGSSSFTAAWLSRNGCRYLPSPPTPRGASSLCPLRSSSSDDRCPATPEIRATVE